MKNLIKKIVAGVSVTTMLFCGLSVTDERHSYNLTNLSANAEEGFYNSAEEFLESAYDESNVTIYNGNTKHSFNMNGRSFYQGLVFTKSGEVNYNVENVDSLKFTIGHVDGSGEMNVNFKIYLDDKEYDNFDLYKTMSLKDYEIDTSNSKVLKIVTSFGYGGSNSFALADFSVDSYNPPKTCSIPEYNSEADFMNSGFNISNMKVYDGSNKDNAFNMNGRSFSQGLVFTGNSEVNYNVENVDSLRFTIGHVDNGDIGYYDNVKIYLDEKEYDNFDLYKTMSLKEYDIDTSKAKVLRIFMSGDGEYAFADFSVDSYIPSKTYTIPEYDNEVDFINSGFNISNMKVYDGSNKNVFNMNGRSFYQGLVFTKSGSQL